jgi:hypothetical protein
VCALRLALTIGHAAAMCEAFEGLAHVAAATGDCAEAAALLDLADAHREHRSLPRRPYYAEWTRQLRDRIVDVTAASSAAPQQSLEDEVHPMLRSWDRIDTSAEVTSGGWGVQQSEVTSSPSSSTSVICRPAGASRRALSDRHGVCVSASSSAPAETRASVNWLTSVTSNATRMLRLTCRPTSSRSMTLRCSLYALGVILLCVATWVPDDHLPPRRLSRVR